jgi:hypothetical protein
MESPTPKKEYSELLCIEKLGKNQIKSSVKNEELPALFRESIFRLDEVTH